MDEEGTPLEDVILAVQLAPSSDQVHFPIAGFSLLGIKGDIDLDSNAHSYRACPI